MSSKNIVVWGESGEGKSTLINNLVGEKVAQTGKTPGGVTKDLKGYKSPMGTLWDLPGAGDNDVPAYKSLQLLEATFTGDRKIDGLLILSKNPNRIHIGAKIVMQLMNLSFSNADKWDSVGLVGTFADKWDEGDEDNFRTGVLKVFNEEVQGSISKVVCIDHKDFSAVESLIEGMTGMGDFSMPDPHSIADVVVKVTGVDPKDVPKETEKIIDALRENNARLAEALEDLKEKGGPTATENFTGLHFGPLGKIGFSW